MKYFLNFLIANLLLLSVSSSKCFSQQVADIVIPKVKSPKFKKGEGFIVFIDESHCNFHTKSGRFNPFARLLEADGHKVDSISNFQRLSKNDILVISNAVHKRNRRSWQRPIYSAFTKQEVKYIKSWVEKGGRLLLIADHMPFAGATKELGNAFGFGFCDGFAQIRKESGTPDIFSNANGRLLKSVVTNGASGFKVKSVTTFTGSSFSIPKKAIGILKFKKGDECLTPEIAWRFNDNTPSKGIENYYQGAIMNFGKGKLAVFGEAGMFTAQTVTNQNGTFKFGFHAKTAANNITFIRNLIYWLGKN